MTSMAHVTSIVTPAWHDGFMTLLPAIHSKLRFAFRGLKSEANQEAIQEAVASAAVAYARLYEQGRADLAYATPLANFAVRQYVAGRRVGGQLNVNDVMSRYAQRFHHVQVGSLDRRDDDGTWKEILVEDQRSTPAETAAARIDFGDWLGRLCRRDRGVAMTLATGETTRDTAKQFYLTPGRVSQLRKELKKNWQRFQGEPYRRCRRVRVGAVLIDVPDLILITAPLPGGRRGGMGITSASCGCDICRAGQRPTLDLPFSPNLLSGTVSFTLARARVGIQRRPTFFRRQNREPTIQSCAVQNRPGLPHMSPKSWSMTFCTRLRQAEAPGG